VNQCFGAEILLGIKYKTFHSHILHLNAGTSMRLINVDDILEQCVNISSTPVNTLIPFQDSTYEVAACVTMIQSHIDENDDNMSNIESILKLVEDPQNRNKPQKRSRSNLIYIELHPC